MTVKSYIQIGTEQVRADTVSIPANRSFRAAWQLEADVISVDMTAARDIQRDMLRTTRLPLLEALDAAFMKALETGQDTTAIAAEKQKLRDLPADPRLEAAQSPAELESLTLEFLLNN